MQTLEQLAEAREAELRAAETILAMATDQDRDPTSEEMDQVEAHNAKADELTASIKTKRRQEEIAEQTRNLRHTVQTLPEPKTAATTEVRESWTDDPRRGFKHVGEFARCVMTAQQVGPVAMDNRLRLVAAATGMQQRIGADGGFLVPPAFSSMIWDGLNTGSDSLLGQTDNYTIDGESLTFPANAETSRATGSRYGGVRGYWLAEADQITSSAPKLRQLKLEPQELAVLVYATDKLLKNSSGALDQYITRAATEEIGFLVGDAIVNGDGVGKPMGILNSAATVSVAKETSQAADTIVRQNINKMWARLHPRSRPSAVWLANVDTEPELDNLFLPVTNVAGSENVGGLNTNIYNPAAQTLKGRPIIYTEYNATLGDVGDLILVDLGAYASGTRGGVDSAMSIHLRFDYAETAFRFMFAVDGQTWLNSALTPFKGSNTLTTVVTLAARA